MDSQNNAGKNAGNEAAVPMVPMVRKRDKPLAVMHVDRLETYRGTAVPAWMTTEQRECVAV